MPAPKNAKTAKVLEPLEPLIDELPDVLGDAGRAQVVAGILLDLQKQMAQNEAIMVANAQTLADPSGHAGSGGLPVSYGERQTMLRDAQKRVAAAYAAVMPEVEKLIGSG